MCYENELGALCYVTYGKTILHIFLSPFTSYFLPSCSFTYENNHLRSKFSPKDRINCASTYLVTYGFYSSECRRRLKKKGNNQTLYKGDLGRSIFGKWNSPAVLSPFLNAHSPRLVNIWHVYIFRILTLA